MSLTLYGEVYCADDIKLQGIFSAFVTYGHCMLITSYQLVHITLLRQHDQKHLILTGTVVSDFLVFGRRFVARLNHSDVMTDAKALKKILRDV